ncbi:alkaline phosphatase family protein [Pseudorhodoplanes sinuspersici]|uniref:Nucleotide pyrophosphatase n=1 Tax=Pseudorhodoplanes sinuspersici TaxID=1235591 RepID=A0A1W6ZQL4_9HYPH|nr:alkaline phosphatase family protein [Pseudorhodoplanes sinuspersici]ARP99651.1 nucleotide pyrophosphatase [Pseudorhodoplanes sinuspersici]RKE70629.1 putative AlkP superfamily pyrophosphatase or phosphodiesterase [Pseudorhodoplanes sinuspersici]
MHRAILVILDGLRRDLISTETTPHLAAFARQSEQFANYRTIFPSCTRVVSASLTTGCYPARHGLQGNTMALLKDGHLVRHDAGHPDFLQHKRRVTGRSLHVPTLAERVKDSGGAIVFNNVSPGAAYAHDPDGYGHVYHRAGSFGPGRIPVPEKKQLRVTLDEAGERAMTQRFIDEAVLTRSNVPALAILWLGEPDATQHAKPLGSPDHIAVLQQADRNAGRVMDAVATLPESEKVLFLVGSDHGHQTVEGVIDIEAELIAAGLKDSLDSGDVIVASNGTSALIYLHPDLSARESLISEFLASCDWAETVISRNDLPSIGQASEHGLIFALSMRSSNAPNCFGIAGTSLTAQRAGDKADVIGAGQHGGLGASEQAPFLMIAGQGFGTDAVRSDPACVVDIAPTILTHLGLPISGMDGRPLQMPLMGSSHG